MLHSQRSGHGHCHPDHCCSPRRGWASAGEVVVVLVAIPARPAAFVPGCRPGRGTRRDRRTIQVLAGR